MHPDVVRRLRCPVCGRPLTQAGAGPGGSGGPAVARGPLRCPDGHSFDIARKGYANLLTGRAPHSGDTAEMVAARENFLAAGHYDAILTALATAALDATNLAAPALDPRAPTGPAASRPAGADRTSPTGSAAAEPVDSADPGPALVVDAGAGTGRHLAAVLDALPGAVGLAVDVSKPALRRAARAHPRAAAALADTWRPLPLADASVALLLNVFAPRNGPEFRRALRPDGTLLVVTPTEDHLAELVGALDLLRVDPDKADRVAGSLAGLFDPVATTEHRFRLTLTRDEVLTLVGMGPSAWHTDPVRLAARLATLTDPLTVGAAVRLTAYRPAPGGPTD